jgi:hypothetical protein
MVFIAAINFSPPTGIAQPKSNEEKVAVLITGWGPSAGYNFEYAWNSHYWCRVGDKTEYEGQPCKIGHVGEFPYQLHLGLVPWALHTETEGWERSYDNSGIYKLIDGVYESVYPGHPSLPPEEVPAGAPIIPAKDVVNPMTGALYYPLDPRTGEDYLAGWYQIGIGASSAPYPNGLGDLYEKGPLSFMWRVGLLGGPAELPEAYLQSPHAQAIMDATKQMLDESFGDAIDVRFGQYNGITGYTEHEQEVAQAFAAEGFRKMLIARETTDNNHYANNFLSGNYVKEALCENGVLDETEIYQTRQVGRTPEFNAMNIMNLKPYIETYPEGSTIGIIYITRGLPWGSVPGSSAMGTQHPWHLEVYHENAYLNFLSWKKAIQKAYGDRYNLVFTKGGVESDLLVDNLYAYALYTGEKLGGHFQEIRETIQSAKADGIDKLILAPCHWFYDDFDNLCDMRLINGIPFVPKDKTAAGIFDLTYCEDADGNEVSCASEGDVAEVTVVPSYSHMPAEFATSYYVVLRGTLERFGLYPDGLNIVTGVSQMVAKLDGGTLEVTSPSSAIQGARIVIPADPYPSWPEGFTPQEAIPINDPRDTNDCLWEDTVINIGQQINPPVMEGIQPAGPAVHFGPYRTFFNRDVSISIPYDSAAAAGKEVKPYVYNDLTESWDELEAETIEKGLVTFKTQVLGLFQAGGTSRCPIVQLYGENAEEVLLLRNFRDRVLSASPAGKELIRLYYAVSPVIVKAMVLDKEFKQTVEGMVEGVLAVVKE